MDRPPADAGRDCGQAAEDADRRVFGGGDLGVLEGNGRRVHQDVPVGDSAPDDQEDEPARHEIE